MGIALHRRPHHRQKPERYLRRESGKILFDR
jgi:hypothetical protein